MFSNISISDAIMAMRWEDFVDILAVALIAFYIIKLVKGTSSGQVFLGLGLVGVTYFLSAKFELLTLRFLMSSFISNIMLIMVVLFASDIRRGLARAARFSLPFSKNPQAAESINEVVRTSFFMAEKRIGALIVFERRVNLGEFVETGQPLGAIISDRLLMAIFTPPSPLHDGAVIIQNGNLTAAGCFLPLIPTESEGSDSFLGTRHRAAIGLSVETDAVVVVVSEERGIVSLVKDGEVFVMMGATNLRDKLLTYLGLSKLVNK